MLLGISLATEDEAWFFGAVVRVSQKVGSWPMPIMRRLLPGMGRSAKAPDTDVRELIEDLKQNKPGDAVRVSSDYPDYIACGSDARARGV